MSSSSSSSDTAAVFDVVLRKTQEKTWVSFAPDELSSLISAFTPHRPAAIHTKGYLVLSAFCQRRRSEASTPEEGTESICGTFNAPVASRIADTEESEALAGLTFLSSLFDVDHLAGSAIFARDGTLEATMDSLDLFPKSRAIELAVAHLLGRAAAHKSCRALFVADHRNWLEWKSRQADDAELRAAAAVALVKLGRGSKADAAEVGGTPEQNAMEDDELAALMKGLVVDSREASSLGDAVEGLAYMSTNPAVKETLSKDSAFLARLFTLVPKRKGAAAELLGDSAASPLYGTVVIITNLCVYRPRLSAEEAQIAKLRQMAKSSKGPGPSRSQQDENEPLDDDDHVKERGRRLLKAGAMEALTSAVRATGSRAVHSAVGKAILSLVEDKENRGKVLQAGGAKALQAIIQAALPPSIAKSSDSDRTPQMDKGDFDAIQALAKLAITAAPVQVFGPNEGTIYDAIRPFALMLTHPNASLLQGFEAMMALTNLSSVSAEAATRIARADGLTNKVELLMLEDHTLVRRAATELVCNLIAGSEEIFNKWGGDRDNAARGKLQVLVALCDVDDLPTRLAASGALATLTASPDACESLAELERERHRVLPILGQLIDPSVVARPAADEGVEEDEQDLLETDPGLVHRGIVCVRNLFVGVQGRSLPEQVELASEANRVGIVRALVGTVKSCANNPSSAILRPAAEALKWLLEHGVDIPV